MMPYCLVLAWRPELRPAEKLKYLKYYYSSLNKMYVQYHSAKRGYGLH
jgi:hypothetical protein